MRPWTLRSLGVASALLALGACSLPIQLPKDFVQLEEYEEFHAVTGDDARLSIREFEDPHEAPLEFWAQAVEYDFTQQRGYQLVGSGEVRNHSGLPGRWLECAADVSGERTGYLVAIWVDGYEVQVVEFAARADVFKARVEGVRAALATVRW